MYVQSNIQEPVMLQPFFEHLTSKQYTETDSLISEDRLRSRILEVGCDEDVMIHYNNNYADC